MPTADLTETRHEDHRALNALVRGDPEPKKRMFSRTPEVTLANPVGPPVRGWEKIEAALDEVVPQLHEGGPIDFETVSAVVTEELAYIVEIERWHGRVGLSQTVPLALRATTVFRREHDGAWRIIHRHADPITTPRPVESIITAP